MKNLTVKNVKLHEDMSEETPCFSADLYDNGKLVAHVKNDGRGGCNMLTHPKGADTSINLYEKYGDLDTDSHIMGLVEDYNYVTKNQSKKFILSKDGKVYEAKFPAPIGQIKKKQPEWLAKEKKRFEVMGYKVLNRNL